MKKVLSFLLTLSLLFCFLPAGASAADTQAAQSAETLYTLGLFKGTGTNKDGSPIYQLEGIPTRNQAIIMLVRLLGKEQEALSGTWDLPFTDVAKGSTAYPYIGYAYAHGLTGGTTATTYSGTNPIRFNQYITFVLRALGYESGKDFEVGTAWEFSDEIGLTNGTYSSATKSFTRGDVAAISCSALSVCKKGSSTTLLEQLLDEGAVSMGAALIAGVMPGTKTVTLDLEIEDGACTFTYDALKKAFPKAVSWSYIEMKPHLVTDIDTCIARSDQMSSLLYTGKSNYQGSASFRALFDRPDKQFSGRIELLVFDGVTNLCAFAVGTPVTIDRKLCRFTFVTCDYDFAHVYRECKEEYSSLPYIKAEDVATCGAKYFFSNTSSWTPKNINDYYRHQVAGLWGDAGVPIQHSTFWHDIAEYPLAATYVDVPEEWTTYLLLDETGKKIGFTHTIYRADEA